MTIRSGAAENRSSRSGRVKSKRNSQASRSERKINPAWKNAFNQERYRITMFGVFRISFLSIRVFGGGPAQRAEGLSETESKRSDPPEIRSTGGWQKGTRGYCFFFSNQQFFHSGDDVVRTDVVGLFERCAGWCGRIRQTDSRYRRPEMVEDLTYYCRRNFGRNPASFPGRIRDHEPARLADRTENAFAVPRLDRAQINYLCINSAAFERGSGPFGMGAHVGSCHDGHISSRSPDRREPNRHLVYFLGNLASLAVEPAVVNVHHGIAVIYGRDQ